VRRFLPGFLQPRSGVEAWQPGSGIRSYREMRPEFERELRRARRYERPLSVLVLVMEHVGTLDTNRVGAPAGGDAAAPQRADPSLRRQARLHLTRILPGMLRESDIACMADVGEFVLMLPEVTSADTRRIASRIVEELGRTFSASVQFAAVDYPTSGLTVDQLVDSALQTLRGTPVAEWSVHAG
jgi:hypothetical protein